MKYRGFLLATTGGLAAAGGAQAADLPTKAPAYVPAPVPFIWEGFYLGVNVGAAWQHSDVANYPGYSANVAGSSFIGGGQIGYNWQHGNIVYGVEADIQGLSGSANASFGSAVPANKSVDTKIRWLSTVRGRAGLVVGDTMAYATGGVAFGGVRNELNNLGGNTNKSESKTRVGWVIGGGVEHMWTRNWTVGLEGLFVDLGNSTANGSASPGKTTKFTNQAVIGRLKLNYKF